MLQKYLGVEAMRTRWFSEHRKVRGRRQRQGSEFELGVTDSHEEALALAILVPFMLPLRRVWNIRTEATFEASHKQTRNLGGRPCLDARKSRVASMEMPGEIAEEII